MIIVNLTFGLGNNLFQYALGRNLALKNNTELLFDLSEQNRGRQQYLLNYLSHFNTTGCVANKSQIAKIKLLNRFSFLNPKYKNSVLNENFYEDSFGFDPKVLNAPENAYIHGYWQSEKYFKDAETALRRDFTFKNSEGDKYEEILNEINNSNSVSVHVRRGDYLWNKNQRIFTACTPNYYYAAEKFISEKVSSPKLFIFSDDIEWIKTNMSFHYPAVFVTDGNFKDYHELMLMAACKHNIIANSTYSWWGAWLNNNPGKIVVTPKKWFVIPTMNEKDLLPLTWIKI